MDTDIGAASHRGPESKSAVHAFLRNTRLRFLHLRAAARFLMRCPDVVHFQWFVGRRQDLRFIRMLRWLRIPVIYTAHDVEPHLTASDRDREELQRIYDAVSRIVVHAESNRRELLSLFPVEPGKVVVIPHGTYDLLCDPERLTPDPARERLGVSTTKKVILFFGLIKRYKGLEYLVEAFEEVRRRVNDAFLLIVGDIYAADTASHAFYSGLIEKLHGRDDVLCVARYVPWDSVGDYLSASDVIVLPYARTFQSGVLLAAYAAGRPVVVTDTGGLGEVVEQGKSGFVVPPRDPKALAEGIISVLSDKKLRTAMGERGRVLARTVYSWDSIAARTMELYESALGTEADSLTNKQRKTGTSPATDGRTANNREDEGRRVSL